MVPPGMMPMPQGALGGGAVPPVPGGGFPPQAPTQSPQHNKRPAPANELESLLSKPTLQDRLKTEK